MRFFFLLIIGLYFLILAAIAQVFNPIAELAISIRIPREEVKAEFEIHSVIVKAKIRKCPISFRVVQTFLCFLLIISFCFISSRK